MPQPIEEKQRKRAAKVAGSPSRLRGLVEAVLSKTDALKGNPVVARISEKAQPLLRMLKSFLAGEYRQVPWQTIVLITAALLYFLTPFDAIADFIPMLGFSDDLALLTAVIASIKGDIEAFLEWERSKAETAEPADYEELPDDQPGNE